MVNKKLIKHFFNYEIKIRKKNYSRSIPTLIVIMGMLRLAPSDVLTNFGPLMFVIIGISSLMVFPSPLIQTAQMNNTAANKNDQSELFNLKYIHSIAHHKDEFLVAMTLPVLYPAMMSIILTFLGLIILGYSQYLNHLVVWIIPYFLFGICLRVFNFSMPINNPRKMYYQYNQNLSFFQSLLKDLEKGFFSFIQLVLFICGPGLFVLFFFEFSPSFTPLAVSIVLLYFIVLAYRYVINLWTDERNSEFKVSNTISRFKLYIPVFLVMLFANLSVHGGLSLDTYDLHDYVEENNLEELRKYKIKPEELSSTSDGGKTPLHIAVSKGNLEIVKILIKEGAPINLLRKDLKKKKSYLYKQFTPLMSAIYYNENGIMEFLLSSGADINIKTKNGIDAFAVSANTCNLPAMKLLLLKGVDINKKLTNGLYPIHLIGTRSSCLGGYLFLKKNGADMTVKGPNGLGLMDYYKKENPRFYNELLYFKGLSTD